jgi:ribosome-associated protein
MEFKLNSEFIELDNLLKAAKLVMSGAEAKQKIQSGLVKVNGQVERRIRRKLRLGDIIEFKQDQIKVIDQYA